MQVSYQKKLHYYRVLRQNIRVAGFISTAKSLANTVLNHGGETLQRWRAVDDIVSSLNSPGIEPQTSQTEVDANTEKI